MTEGSVVLALLNAGVVLVDIAAGIWAAEDVAGNARFRFSPDARVLLDDLADPAVDQIVKQGIMDYLDEILDGGSKGVKRSLADNMDEIAADIININKKYSDGFEMNNSIMGILNSALYYDDLYEQVFAVARSIADHAFVNGNKRTAFDTMNMLLDDFDLISPLTEIQKWDLITKLGKGEIKDVSEISKILKGL